MIVKSQRTLPVEGRWAIHADADELLRLRQLRQVPRSWPQPYPTELITPKPKTYRQAISQYRPQC